MSRITREDLSALFDSGWAEDENTHMIIVKDDFDGQYYPVYVTSQEDVRERIAYYQGQSMQIVMEVYNLNEDKDPQMVAPRAWFV